MSLTCSPEVTSSKLGKQETKNPRVLRVSDVWDEYTYLNYDYGGMEI